MNAFNRNVTRTAGAASCRASSRRQSGAGTGWRVRGACCCLAVTGLAAAQEPVRVPLTSMPLTNAGVVLSASSFNAANEGESIVYYLNYGTELILPRNALAFAEKSPRQTLRIGDATAVIAYRNGDFTIASGGQTEELRDGAGLGYESVRIPVGGNVPYVLSFPRGFSFKGEGRLFCRSGTVQAGTVGGAEVRLYDDDLDGRYVKSRDGLSVGDQGGMGIFGPISEYLPTPDAVFRIQAIAADGSAITLIPHAGPTGRLTLNLAATNVECRLAFASEDGTCAFGTLVGGQGASLILPAGRYRFLYGYVYRPAARHVVCLVLPSPGTAVAVGKGEEVRIVLGDQARRDWPWGEGVVRMTFEQVLALDLSDIEEACSQDDFLKAQKLFDEMDGKHKAGPNRDVTKVWLEELRQRLALETSPQGTALREAEQKAAAAVDGGNLESARNLLPEVQNQLARIPAGFAASWTYLAHRTAVSNLAGYAAGTSKPGLKVTNTDHGLRPKGGTEVARTVDWGTPKYSSQFFGKIYEGFLVVPKAGEYELALESASGARLHIDGQKVIDHWGTHTPGERTAKLKLAEGRHPLKIEMYATLGTFCLHFRWTPPDGRKAVVPAWALARAAE